MEENTNASKDANQLNTFVDRIERLEEEKKELSADIREVFSEAKGAGFDVKVLRQVLKLRKMDPADRAETEFLRDEYKKLFSEVLLVREKQPGNITAGLEYNLLDIISGIFPPQKMSKKRKYLNIIKIGIDFIIWT